MKTTRNAGARSSGGWKGINVDEQVERQSAYKRSFALAGEVLAAAKAWPASQKGVYSELRRAAAELPAAIAAALLRKDETAAKEGLQRAIEIACRVEVLLEITIAKGGQPPSDTLTKLRGLAGEAREALQDHMTAMDIL